MLQRFGKSAELEATFLRGSGRNTADKWGSSGSRRQFDELPSTGSLTFKLTHSRIVSVLAALGNS